MDLSWFSCVMDSCGKLFQNSNGEEFQKVRTDIDIVRFIHADKIKVNYCENDCIEDDNIFRLAYRTGQVWQCIERILDMWENCEIKGQKEGADMKLGQWKQIQGLYDEEIVVPILRKVVLGNLSLWEMGREFARYKLQHVVQQAFVKGLEEETWSTCKTNYKDFATDNIVKEFFPVCKGWVSCTLFSKPKFLSSRRNLILFIYLFWKEGRSERARLYF